jgi:hypothetical protein
MSQKQMPSPIVPFLFTALAFPLAVAAEEKFFIDEQEPIVPSSVREAEPWKETRGDLPPWPRDSDLVEFKLDAPSPFRYFIDGRNLRIGKDEVVRYTLVAESPSGARNVSFEGLRCTANGAYQTYAYGANGSFQVLPETDWLKIAGLPGDALHKELHKHFLCGPLTFKPRPRKDMIRALQGQIAEKENSGFQPD